MVHDISWQVVSRFKEAQALLRLVYRRADANRASRQANTELVYQDGVFRPKARQVLRIPTRHGDIVFRTNTRGMDTQRLRKRPRSERRAIQVHTAWNMDLIPCDSMQVVKDTEEDIATYLRDTLKWKSANKHPFQHICPLFNQKVPLSHNTSKGQVSFKSQPDWSFKYYPKRTDKMIF